MARDAPLPVVQFVQVDDDNFSKPAGVADKIIKSYGYNDGSEFERPDHYIRHIEPLESELAVQVEYDMDEQDKEWLDAINVERQRLSLDKCNYELFEILMDRLEKEWFDLTKNLPNTTDIGLPAEDSTCAICDDSEGENSNAIVFCDGCNLAVHQDCYGVPYIPEGQWLCRKCTVSPENPVNCILCPNEGGAFKQTTQGAWVHLLCAIWVPETRVMNEVFMEPITGIDKISKQRWKLRCTVCGVKGGASIQCARSTCFTAFHPTCARSEKLLMPMKHNAQTDPDNITLTAYCDKHLPPEQAEVRATALASSGRKRSEGLSKSARAYAKTYKPGPPLIPRIIIDRILTYTSRIKLLAKHEFVTFVARYWSLKREARRGAGLLKRLHLEPWTSNKGGLESVPLVELKKQLGLLQHLQADLVAVQNMASKSKQREQQKADQAQVQQEVVMHFLLAHEGPMRMAFESVIALDRKDYFKTPVLKSEVPDYFDIIKTPMCWNMIDAKLDRHEYWDLQQFKDDIKLVLSNALLYNKKDTPFSKAALRIGTATEPILAKLDALAHKHTDNQIGDLEPPLEDLALLISDDSTPLDVLYAYMPDLTEPVEPEPTKPAPPVVLPSDIDKRTSFQFFETGIVLPEGSSRRSSSRFNTDRPIVPLPKRAQEPIDQEDLGLHELDKVDHIEVTQRGTQVIHIVETPAIRRAKNALEKRKREERKKLEREAAAAADEEVKSDASSALSEPPGSDSEQPPPAPVGKVTDRGFFTLKPKQKIPEDTIVWAKQGAYPWWPGRVFHRENTGVPKHIKNDFNKDTKSSTKPGVWYFILFYGSSPTWGWFQTDKIKQFGVDEIVDQDMISTTSHHNRWRSKLRDQCRAAYRQAKAALETDDDED